MAEDDSPQRATDAGRKADLEALFAAWDDRDGVPGDELDDDVPHEARQRLLSYGVRVRLVVSLVLIGITAWVMYSTHHRFLYWVGAGDTVDLGDLRERWANGDRAFPGESNTHVRLDGLVITRPLIARAAEDADAAAEAGVNRLFFCPMYGIVVRTQRPLPEPAWHRMGTIEIDERLVELLQNRQAFPSDLTVSFGGEGRLVRGAQVPEDMRRAVNTYALKTKREADELWVFIDGDAPSSHSVTGIVWGLAAVVPLVSLLFLLRAMRLRARHARSAPHPPTEHPA